jgi:uncharacterized protein YkwD
MVQHRSSRKALAVVALLALAFGLTACLNAEQQSTFDWLNTTRKQNGRSALVTQTDAQNKAQAWAEKMAREKRMYHSTLTDGIGSGWCALGENVGYGSTAAAVQKMWMESTGHRTNILDTRWNGVGVGLARSSDGVLYMAQVFIKTC